MRSVMQVYEYMIFNRRELVTSHGNIYLGKQLAQVLASCLAVPSLYLNQYQRIITACCGIHLRLISQKGGFDLTPRHASENEIAIHLIVVDELNMHSFPIPIIILYNVGIVHLQGFCSFKHILRANVVQSLGIKYQFSRDIDKIGREICN